MRAVTGERIAVVGARAHPDLEEVRAFVLEEVAPGDTIVSGGATGVDRMAEETAVLERLTVVSYRVEGLDGDDRLTITEWVWTPGRGKWRIARTWQLPKGTSMRDALIFRNTFIAIACTSMQAFTRGTKGGTADAMRQAKRFHRPVFERGEPPGGILLPGLGPAEIDATPKDRS